jgi:hypothetical protein
VSVAGGNRHGVEPPRTGGHDPSSLEGRPSPLHDTRLDRSRNNDRHAASTVGPVHYTLEEFACDGRGTALPPDRIAMHPEVPLSMTDVHMIVGSLVVIAYIIVLVLNVRTAMGRPMLSFQRPLSMAAAGLFLIQILLGMSLLGEGKDIPAAHFLIALLAIFPIGAEHMLTGREVDSRRAGRVAAIANAITLALVLIAYIIGETNGS